MSHTVTPAVYRPTSGGALRSVRQTVAIGFAIFSMFFGAGNAIFPLFLGTYAGDKNLFAILGLLITAILVPFTGLISVLLFESKTSSFFARIGKIPGALLAFVILLLIGPFGGIPRCIALAHAMFSLILPQVPLWLFGLVASLLLFVCCIKKRKVVALLGYFLTPLLLGSLVVLIACGLVSAPAPASSLDPSSWSVFVHGLKEGYNTLDLLAAFFFSTVVLSALRSAAAPDGEDGKGGRRRFIAQTIGASVLAALLLGLIYAGLSFVAASHGRALGDVDPDYFFGVLGFHLLGPTLGIVAAGAVVLACMTTAIALTSIFAEGLKERVFKGRVGYLPCLGLTLVIAYFVSYLKVVGIVALIAPVVTLCYPALIVLSLLNIAYKVTGFKPVKWPFYGVLAATLVIAWT